jgi:hypothetical protein
MNETVSLATVKQEIEEAKECSEAYDWGFTLNLENQSFTVLLQSPVDQEKYLLEFCFDDYPEKPYLINFIHPVTGARNSAGCLPKGHDSFFHPRFTICHPCSRGAYVGYTGLHGDWDMAGWQLIAGGMTSLKFILITIQERISNENLYQRGRL